jgi:general secretion pathway protein C
MYPYLLAIFIGYCVADLGILQFRDRMLPQSAPPAHPKAPPLDSNPGRGTYNTIISRNIFSADGVIPDALALKGQDPRQKEAAPVPSSLPLNLVGTLVHSNPEKSIASIEVKSKQQIVPFRANGDIFGLATVVSIERERVVLRNTNSNRLEYIEMKKDAKVNFGGSAKPLAAAGKDVQKIGDNTYAIKRADLLKYTNDLSSVLMQARAVPNRVPGTGEINGFRLLDIQPGSIFEQLGLQRMDVIKGVDGNPVDSPAKAMELYNALKNSNKLGLQIERSGKTETLNYNIQ